MSARWVPAPTPGANLVDVRARRTETRGTRHFVERQPNQLVDDAAPALCGQTASRGWVNWPSHTAGTCMTCWRRAAQWRLAAKDAAAVVQPDGRG